MLLGLRRRGLTIEPKLVVAADSDDGGRRIGILAGARGSMAQQLWPALLGA
jgi:hypothetical protein